MRINFDFADLESFLEVYKARSFHMASEKLGLSQPSVTRRIKKLETALDSALFERTTRAVRPTLAAKRLKVRAEAILAEARETALALRDESNAYAHQRARTLSIATIPTVVSTLLAPALCAFRDRYPHVRFQVIDVSVNEVAEAVLQGEAEIGICSVPTVEPGIIFELLFNDPMALAVHPDHQLAAKDSVRWSDLSGEQLILPTRDTGNRSLIDDAMAHAGLPLVWSTEVGRTSTALDLVAAHAGVAPLPLSALSLQNSDYITARRLSDPDISRAIGLLTRIGHKPNSLVQDFASTLRATAVERWQL